MDLFEGPTEFYVSAIPPERPAFRYFALWVQWRGGDRWSVSPARNMGPRECLDAEGEWVWDDPETTRFDLATALRLAREAAPGVTVNGFGVQHALNSNWR